jgi:hypothetical protein
VSPAVWRFRWPSDGATCFAPDEQTLYLNYDIISAHNIGWTLSEIRLMTYRQRNYWLKMITWKRDKRANA